MLSVSSSLSRLSPLAAQAPKVTRLEETGPGFVDQDQFELSLPSAEVDAAEAPAPRSGGWKKWALAGALGVSAAASIASSIGPVQVVIQQLLNPNSVPNLSLTEQLAYQGYAGEAATDRAQVMTHVRGDFARFDSAHNGKNDGVVSVRDLQQVAADANAPEASREAAQALLADPVLLNSVMVADGGKVNHQITLTDLDAALQNEAGGDFGSFNEVRQRLEVQHDGTSTFDYLAELSGREDQIDWGTVQQAAQSSETPQVYRTLAEELVANPNYFNAYDVANASHHDDWFTGLTPGQRLDGIVSAADLDAIAFAPIPESGRQFSEADTAALDRIINGEGEIADNLFSAFRQTDRGNCASTAVIKAAMDRYGANLFQDVSKQPDNSYLVTMMDGVQIQVSASELEAAATATHYRGPTSETKSLATLSYATMAKRAWMTGHEGAQTYGQALLSLNNGEQTPRVPGYLGLGDKVQSIDQGQVVTADGAVVYGNGHAYYVDNLEGQMMGDKWGTATPWQGRTTVDEGELQSGGFILQP